MSFPSYAPQALDKQAVRLAMIRKYNEARREVRMYEAGIAKLEGIEDRSFYELTYKNSDDITINLFVQCWKIRRDSIWFRIFSSDHEAKDFRTALVHDNETVSLSWHWNWQVVPAKREDAPKYFGFDWKTSHYEKLLKGTYRS